MTSGVEKRLFYAAGVNANTVNNSVLKVRFCRGVRTSDGTPIEGHCYPNSNQGKPVLGGGLQSCVFEYLFKITRATDGRDEGLRVAGWGVLREGGDRHVDCAGLRASFYVPAVRAWLARLRFALAKVGTSSTIKPTTVTPVTEYASKTDAMKAKLLQRRQRQGAGTRPAKEESQEKEEVQKH